MKFISQIHEKQNELTGHIRFHSQSVKNYSRKRLSEIFSYTGSENRVNFPMTVEQYVSLGRLQNYDRAFYKKSLRDDKTIDFAIQECFLDSFKNRSVLNLSGGELQRVALARLIAQDAKIIILDESFSKVDLSFQEKIAQLLKKQSVFGKTVIWVSHDLNYLSTWVDELILINQGKCIASGVPDDVLTRENLKKLYPDVDIKIGLNPETQRKTIYY